MIHVTGWYLELSNGESHKFYGVYWTPDSGGWMFVHYGKIGATGGTVGYSFADLSDASRRVGTKLAAGYHQIHGPINFGIEEGIFKNLKDGNAATGAAPTLRAMLSVVSSAQSAVQSVDVIRADAERIMSAVTGSSFESVWAEYQGLEEAWEQLEEKFRLAEVAVTTAREMISQRIMSGNV